MIPLYTPAQVRALDEQTIAGGTPGAVLMERAAFHLARAVVRAAGRSYGLPVLVVCGKGNNAGDGIGAARRLRALGADARIHLALGEDGLSDDAGDQLRRSRAAGIREEPSLRLDGVAAVVDCLLGTGSTGEPRPPLNTVVDAVNNHRDASGAVVIACDVATGCDADGGAVAGSTIRADITLTIGAHKRGLWLWPARGVSGRIECADIGTLASARPEPAAHVLEDGDAAAVLSPTAPDVDKRGRGVVVVLAGSPGMSGAATMVARGALGTGVGLLTVATDAAARDVVAASVPEAMTVALPSDNPDGAFERLAAKLDGADVLAVGPGLGHAPATVELVRRVVREVDVPIVLDADGLNAFRGEGDLLGDRRATELICTPHARELARLLGAEPDEVWPRRLEEVAKASHRWRATIVAKGPGTIVQSPDGRTWINPTGSAALATGGTGDVLTGILAAARAGGDAPEVVAAGVYVHGRAGEIAARRRPARSVAALDVAAAVPAALASLEP